MAEEMNSNKNTARIVGILFIVAAVTAIVALVLYGSILNDPEYIIKGSANETRVIFGALFEWLAALAIASTSIVLFPILKKQNETLALGYVCGRLFEATIIVVGIISLLAIVTLSKEFVNAVAPNVSSFLVTGKALLAVHDWTFLFGPNFVLGPNTLMLSYLLYKSKLVPRFIAVLGLVGGSLILAEAVAIMLGAYAQISLWGGIFALPVFTFEMTLAVWLMVKGFNSSAIVSESTKTNS